MSLLRPPIPMLFAAMIAGCSDPGPGSETQPVEGGSASLTAMTLGEQVVLPTPDYLKLPRYERADPEYGRTLAMQCRACHNLDDRASSPLGPSLHGLFGRRAGSLDDYAYSVALVEADFVWTPEALDGWLAAPWGFLPGNRMAYAGMPDPKARDALIAFLLQASNAGAADGA